MVLVKYIADRDVDEKMDLKIRDLLTICFPEQPSFARQRFYHEMPSHRWYIEEGDRLTGHVALHEKTVSVDHQLIPVGGIAEVAVHPDARGKKYVCHMLEEAHEWLRARGYDFSMLFGDKRVYASSGYEPLDSVFRYYKPAISDWVREPVDCAMINRLSGAAWPDGVVDLEGPIF